MWLLVSKFCIDLEPLHENLFFPSSTRWFAGNELMDSYSYPGLLESYISCYVPGSLQGCWVCAVGLWFFRCMGPCPCITELAGFLGCKGDTDLGNTQKGGGVGSGKCLGSRSSGFRSYSAPSTREQPTKPQSLIQ